jgi:hypothetical protein
METLKNAGDAGGWSKCSCVRRADRHRHDILHLCWLRDLPVPRGLFGRHDLTIVAKDHVRADVAMSRAGRDASLTVILTGSCCQ